MTGKLRDWGRNERIVAFAAFERIYQWLDVARMAYGVHQ